MRNILHFNKGKLVFQSKTEDIRKKIKDEISQDTYQSLEEIFIDVVSDDGQEKQLKKLSWLQQIEIRRYCGHRLAARRWLSSGDGSVVQRESRTLRLLQSR